MTLKTEWSPDEIKSFREMTGLTQHDFAEALMIDRQQSISEWECGMRPIKSNRILLGILFEKFKSGEIQPREE